MKSYHGILMALTLAVLTLLSCICGLASCAETVTAVFSKTSAANLQWGSLQHDELTRTFAYYIPDGVPQEPVPLVFMLHGGGSNATSIWGREEGQTWKSLADQHKFILILPEGRPKPGDETSHHWNDCRMGITNPDPPSTEDDVGFINKLIDWATLNFNIDQNRIYANGASNGGAMSYRLAIEGGQRFAAIAAIIANLASPTKCTPATHPIPILIMNGTADPIMPYKGGCVHPPACDRGNVMSTTATVTYWMAVNQTEITPSVQALPDIITDDNSTVTVYTYANGTNDTEVILYRIDGGGHTPPGPTQLPPTWRPIVGWKNQDINGPVEIWEFFSKHIRVSSNRIFLPFVLRE